MTISADRLMAAGMPVELSNMINADQAATAAQAATNFITTPSGLFNVSALTLPHWRAAIANVRNGSGRGKVVFIGDSVTMGFGTVNAPGFADAFQKAFPRVTGKLLNGAAVSSLVPLQDASFFGSQGNTLANYNAYDPRVSLGAFTAAQAVSVGGAGFGYITGGGVSTLAFAPGVNIDNFTVYYLQQAGQGHFTTDIDGGASLGDTNTGAGATALGTVTRTVARGIHTININAQNNGNLIINGVVAWDSTIPAIDLIQGGIFGATLSTHIVTTNVNSPFPTLKALAPDLTILEIGASDVVVLTPLATFESQLRTFIVGAQLSGDVLLVSEDVTNVASSSDGTYQRYLDLIKSVALSTGCGVVDMKTRWASRPAWRGRSWAGRV
jgi:hypothetical protein